MLSPDLTEKNIDKLAEVFPGVITESSGENGELKRVVDFDLLRQELSDHIVEGPQERFQLDWPGKRAAAFTANVPIAKTLRPDRGESVDFDTTKNLFIEGDNLDALKLLQESYLGKIKLIYIDPPYNSGSDFVYKDNFAETTSEYLVRSQQAEESGARLRANTESNGRFHSDWLSMLYPRLMVARRIMRPDGVILVSIDDGEHANARALLDQVFGAKNFLAQLIWNKQHSQQQGLFKRYHEFVLAYARDASQLDYISGGDGLIEAGALKKISKANPASDFTFPAGVRFDAPDGKTITGTFGESEKVTVVSGVLRSSNGVTAEPVTLRAGWTQRNQMVSWFAGHETTDTRGQRVVEFFFSSTGKLKSIKERGRITPSTLLPPYGMNSEQTERLATLMGGAVFDNPKPVRMLQDFVEWFTDENDIVLDFFAGSATTAEAVFRAAAEDGLIRHFVLIQLDEACRQDSTAAMSGYANIAEIARERIRRAGAQVKLETPLSLDFGFRMLRVDTTNMADTWRTPDEAEQTRLALDVENIKPDRTGEDLLFQVLQSWGLELSLPISVEQVNGHEVFVVDEGALIACFDKTVHLDLVRALAKREPLRAVFLEAGFRTDDARINAEQIFREVSPSTDVKTI